MTMNERHSHLSPEHLKRAVQNLKEVSAEKPDEIKRMRNLLYEDSGGAIPNHDHSFG
jgi:hypothetical protein